MRTSHQRAQIIDGKKFCAKCDNDLPIASFKPNPKLKSGLSSYCAVCEKGIHTLRYVPRGTPRGRPRIYPIKVKVPKVRVEKIPKVSAVKRPPQTRAERNEKRRLRRATDPIYKMTENIRRAVNGAMAYNKSKKSSKLSIYLGCTTIELKAYLESKFQPGMSWETYGFGSDKWNIDHIVPLASAKTIDRLYELNHFSNLQPLWQPDNFAKRDKMPESNLNA